LRRFKGIFETRIVLVQTKDGFAQNQHYQKEMVLKTGGGILVEVSSIKQTSSQLLSTSCYFDTKDSMETNFINSCLSNLPKH
jgi:hydroxymethylglutaryl-CoA reductase